MPGIERSVNAAGRRGICADSVAFRGSACIIVWLNAGAVTWNWGVPRLGKFGTACGALALGPEAMGLHCGWAKRAGAISGAGSPVGTALAPNNDPSRDCIGLAGAGACPKGDCADAAFGIWA